MKSNKRNIIIVGGENDAGLLAMKIAEMKLENPNVEIVTLNESKERGLTESYEFKGRPPLPELQQITLKDNFYSDGKSARNKRREAERKSKRRKR